MVNEILDDAEGIKKQVMEKTSISKEELDEKIKAKMDEYGGLLNEAGAVFAVSKELGVDLKKQAMTFNDLKVSDLADGLNSATLKVRVKNAYAPRYFEKADKKGNVANFDVFDETGETRFVLWNNAELASRIQKNNLIKIINAYVKKNKDNLEIHSSSKGSVEILEDDSSIPKAVEKKYKLNQLSPGLNDVSFYARIERVYPVYEFVKKDGSQGKVASILVNDGRDSKRLVLWDNHAKLTETFKTNDLIKVEGAYTRVNNDELEIHLGWRGRIVSNPESSESIPEIKTARKTIAQLTNGNEVEIKSDVVEIYNPTLINLCAKCKTMTRDGVCPKCGSTEMIPSLIINAELDDGTGVIRGTFYRDLAEKFIGFKASEFKADNSLFELKKKQLLGDEFIFFGKVKEVPEYNRRELIIKNFAKADINK